jgi:tricorn protease-like protein
MDFKKQEFLLYPARLINNGEKILFDGSVNNQGERNVGIINSDGTNLEMLVGFHSRAIDISPNGQNILFAGDSTGNRSYPWVVSIDGSNHKNLYQDLETSDWGNPIRFTADGKKILYYNRYPEYKVYMVDIESPYNSSVLNEGLPNAVIHISPDEEWLAYYEIVSTDMCFCGTGEVYIQNLKSGEITELKGRGFVDRQVLFTNNNKVIYSSKDGDKSYLYVSDLSKFE